MTKNFQVQKKIIRFFSFSMFALSFLLASCESEFSDAKNKGVENLRVEYLTDPLGIDVSGPRLSWELSSDKKGVLQTAYQIVVASSEEDLKQDKESIWNSGKIDLDEQLDIRYEGPELESGKDYFWRVKVWTNKDEELTSEPGHWSTGLLHAEDWEADWIGLDSSFSWESPHAEHTRLSARYLRKTFQTRKKIKRAVAYVSGLGIYRLFINGERIGDGELSAPTDYNKRTFYNTYEVTDNLEGGENVIGAILGNGRFYTMRWGAADAIPAIKHYGFPKMIFQLEIKYDDGSSEKIGSDESWKITADGPIVANNEFDGELYDATKEWEDWLQPDFKEEGWLDVQKVEGPEGKLVAQMNPQIKIMDEVEAQKVFEIAPDTYIVDMGQNMVGWTHMKMAKGEKGDTVTLRFAETLNPDSSLYLDNMRGAEVTDRYVMKDGKQEWEPHFTYHGFRYIEVTGYPGTPQISDFTGKVVYDDLPTIGHFETSNEVVNQVYKNAFWGIRGNYRGMPTDCPQRDERMGWLGDRAVGSYGESFVFDHNALYAKWLQDIEDAQRADGAIPDVAPTYWEIWGDDVTWPSAYIFIADMLYKQFGNLKPIEKHYDSMKKWMHHIRDTYMEDGIITKDVYGDWCMPPEDPHLIHSQDPARKTEGALLGTSFYYQLLKTMMHFSDLLDKEEDKKEFEDLASKMNEAYNERFFNGDHYSNNTATANILSLAYDLVPEQSREQVFDHVVETTMNEFKGHVSTGLIGAQQLMRTFNEFGRTDIAFKLASNTTYPSWGYMAEQGATTIWELWNGNTADPAMNSGNHVMLLGDLLVWFYEDLAGIKSDDKEIAFKKIIMKPHFTEGLDYINASYHSVRGLIESKWEIRDGRFEWEVTVPANTTAEVYFPSDKRDSIKEGGKKVDEEKGIEYVRSEDGRAVYKIGSGTYHFEAELGEI